MKLYPILFGSVLLETYKVTLSTYTDTLFRSVNNGKGQNINISNLFKDSDLRQNTDVSKDEKTVNILKSATAKAKSEISTFAGPGRVNNGYWWEYDLVKGARDKSNRTKFYITVDPDIKNLEQFYLVLPNVLSAIQTEFKSKNKEIKTKFNVFGAATDLAGAPIMNDFLIFYVDSDLVEQVGNKAKTLLTSKGVTLTERPFEVGKDGDGESHSSMISNLASEANQLMTPEEKLELFLPIVKGKTIEEFKTSLLEIINQVLKEISPIIVKSTTPPNPELFKTIFVNAIRKTKSPPLPEKEVRKVETSPKTPVTSREKIIIKLDSENIESNSVLKINRNLLKIKNFKDSNVYDETEQFSFIKGSINWEIKPNLDSQNKTYLNGSKLTGPKPLSHGDIITIGNDSEDKQRGKITVQ